MKCETPARESGSSRAPAATKKPIATERTPGIRSLITRSPVSSVVSSCLNTAGWYPSSESLSSVGFRISTKWAGGQRSEQLATR
jgi:hypothetical protein